MLRLTMTAYALLYALLDFVVHLGILLYVTVDHAIIAHLYLALVIIARAVEVEATSVG